MIIRNASKTALLRSETDVCSLIGNLKSAAVNSLMPQFVSQFAVEAALS
jgi:hypothetical protein